MNFIYHVKMLVLEMPRTVVIYRSISGFTKKYAEWIAEELEADIFNRTEITGEKLSDYSTIIFGGSLHAVGVNGIKIIKKNLHRLSDKKIIIFAVGATPPTKEALDEIKNKNFTPEEQKKIQFYYLRGGFDYDKLDLKNKILMKLLQIRLTLKRNRTPDEKGMLAAYSKPMDFTKKEKIKKIVDYARNL